MAPNGGPMPQHLPLSSHIMAQQNAYAAQQGAPYMLNPGQDYMSVLGMPQYYGVPQFNVYATIPQQGSQPRRPLTPSQQAPENQQFQVINDSLSCFYSTIFNYRQ